MHRIAILLVLVGCAQQADDTATACGPPYALEVAPTALFFADRAAVAVGGTETYFAVIVDSCGGPGPPSTFTATPQDPTIFREDSTWPLMVHALAPGSTQITIRGRDGITTSIDQDAAVLDHVRLGSHEDGVPAAFLLGAPIAAVNLVAADGRPLIDSSITVMGAPPAVDVNEVKIDSFGIGDHALAITAAGQSWSANVHVVGSIDEVAPRATSVRVPVSHAARICFDAKLGGQVVAGAPWRFTFDSAHAASGGAPNCVDAWSDTPTSFTVTAAALGMTTSTLVTYVQ